MKSEEKEIFIEGIDYHEIVECIAGALDAKDPYTAGHSQRVSDMARTIAEMMGFKKDDIIVVCLSGRGDKDLDNIIKYQPVDV